VLKYNFKGFAKSPSALGGIFVGIAIWYYLAR